MCVKVTTTFPESFFKKTVLMHPKVFLDITFLQVFTLVFWFI